MTTHKISIEAKETDGTLTVKNSWPADMLYLHAVSVSKSLLDILTQHGKEYLRKQGAETSEDVDRALDTATVAAVLGNQQPGPEGN